MLGGLVTPVRELQLMFGSGLLAYNLTSALDDSKAEEIASSVRFPVSSGCDPCLPNLNVP